MSVKYLGVTENGEQFTVDKKGKALIELAHAAEQYVEYFFPHTEMGSNDDAGGRFIKAVRNYQKEKRNEIQS